MKNLIKVNGISSTGHANVTELLIKSGSDINHRDDNLRTPLHIASLEGNFQY